MPEFIRVASVRDIEAGNAKQIVVDGRKIALVNAKGTFYAVDDTCTHEEQSLSEGPVTGEIIVCPKHGSRFNVATGRVLSLPAVRPLRTYPVRVDGDDVLLSLEARPGHGMPHKA